MNKMTKLLMSSGVIALAMGASPALAAGTAAGDIITNTATVSYQVGGVNQTDQMASDTFTVDRKVNFTVSEVGTTTTSVSPGALAAVTTFDVTNLSNSVIDIGLAVTQQVGGTAVHGGTDTFNGTNVKVYVDDGNGTFGAEDTEVTYLDEVAADSTRRVFVVVDIPVTQVTGDVAGVRLTGQALEGGTAGTAGAAITATTGANQKNTMDTVLADTTTTGGNVAYDGYVFAEDDYTVLAAAITASKTSRVISDPVNGTTDPKMIPNAVVEYCVVVSNAAGGATATNINITDVLPTETTYDSAFGIFVNTTVTGGVCDTNGTLGGSYSNGTVTAPLADVAPGTSRGVRFRVSVN